MKNTFIKVLALVLTLVFCLSAVACVNTPDDPDDSNSESESATTDPSDSGESEEATTVGDDLPSDLKYNDEEVTILYWSDVEKLEFVPENNADFDMSDAMQKSLYTRNESVQQRLGVKLSFKGEPGNTNNVSSFVTKAQSDINAAAPEYDIIATYSRTAGSLAVRGCLVDLSDNKYIDLDKAYYPELLHDTLTVGDSLYFVSGDASVNTLYLMYTIYFNKDIAKNTFKIDPDDLYDLVRNKQWTVDKLIELTQNTYANLDGDDNAENSQDVDDQYGFCTLYYHVDAFYTGAGFRLVENKNTGNDLLKLSSDYKSENVVNFTKKLGEWITSANVNVWMSNSGKYRQPFLNGNALFCQDRAYLAEKYLIGTNGAEGVDFSYGILPTPMLDEKQDDYITCIGNPFTLYGISVGAKKNGANRVDMLGAVIECWSSESYKNTTPTLFEVLMKLRYSKESADAEMFDICKNTSTSDLGRVFSTDLSTMSEIWSKAACQNENWTKKSKQSASTIEPKIAEIAAKFAALKQ